MNPNTKFIDNLVIQQIEEHTVLNRKWRENAINWIDQIEIIAKLYKEITELEDFSVYMANEERSYNEDKKLILTIIEKVFAPDQMLHWYFEEKNLHWFDDYNDALLSLYKNIALFSESYPESILNQKSYISHITASFLERVVSKVKTSLNLHPLV